MIDDTEQIISTISQTATHKIQSAGVVESVEPIESIEILITGISGALSHTPDFGKATLYEEVTVIVTGTLDVPDRVFELPIRRNDGRLFVFLAEVVNGEFSVQLNFPSCGSFIYSNDECNIDLPDGTFTVKPIKFGVLRNIM